MSKKYRFIIVFILCLFGSTGCTQDVEPLPDIVNTPTPAASSEPERIGSGDTLQMLYSEPPTTLNPHLALSQTDLEVARITYEPLASYDAEGNLIPFLAAKIPSIENGGVAEDGLSVTWELKDNLFWSDGEPFMAEDVKFTFDFITNPEVESASVTTYDTVDRVEIIDDYTVKVNFKRPNPAWALPFVGLRGLIIPQHIFKDYNGLNAALAPANIEPVGTGPYRILPPGIKPQEILFLGSELVQTNKIVFEPNPSYRNTDQIYFSEIELRGGGTDSEAARLSIGTGEVDVAWDLNIPVDELSALLANGTGDILTTFGATVEQIELNRTDPRKFTAEGENSSLQFPHPFLSDKQVRQAIAYAVDRDAIVELFGAAGRPAYHILVSPPQFASDTVFYDYDRQKAAALLDEAGWLDNDDDGVREKDGQELSVRFQTSANPVRQDMQTIVKDNLEQVGIDVEIRIIDSSVFLGTDVENLNNVQRFTADLQAFPWNSLSPDPGSFLQFWTCDQVAQKSNSWSGFNSSRFCDEQYDGLYEQSQTELDPDTRREIFVQMNDMLTEDVALIPLVDLARVSGVSPDIGGFEPTPWDALTWNIQQWRRVQ